MKSPLKYEWVENAMRYWVSDFDGKFILATSDKEFARRMCAAVNACEGLKTENLENAGRLRDGLETVQRRIEELKAQNARLLEALQEICSEIPDNPKLALTSKIKEIVDAVLGPKDAAT